MKDLKDFKDARLLEALDHIDDRHLSDVMDDLKISPRTSATPTSGKKKALRSLKYVAAVAACALLLSTLIPVVQYVSGNLNSWLPGGWWGDTTEISVDSETSEVIEYDKYILTEEDVAMMDSIYRKKNDLPETYCFFATLERAMKREKGDRYYFGKYGDTIIVWSAARFWFKCCFNLGGYDFNFYNGTMFFITKDDIYYNEQVCDKDLFTQEEIKAFYDHYTDYYLPMASDPYVWLEFMPGLEELTEDEMKRINNDYDDWQYELRYEEGYKRSEKYPEAENYAVRYVYSEIGYHPHRFFHEEKTNEFQYYGKIGDKVILAWKRESGGVFSFEVAGYKFVYNGYCELYVYEDGVFTKLAEAYESGKVTESEVAAINERQQKYTKYLMGGEEETDPPAELKIGNYSSSPIKLTDEEKKKIVWEYIANSSSLEQDLKYTFDVRRYNKQDGAYAVMIDGPYLYSDILGGSTVAGYEFVFPSSQSMYIFKDGVFYNLKLAYEMGIVTEEYIGAIRWDQKTKVS